MREYKRLTAKCGIDIGLTETSANSTCNITRGKRAEDSARARAYNRSEGENNETANKIFQ